MIIVTNSIKKGKCFEREIANLLTERTNVKWLRVPQSGAFATSNNSVDSRFDGDVFTEDSRFSDVVVECKSYSKLSFNDLFSKKSIIHKWINQAVQESKSKDWALFFKLNNQGVFVIDPKDRFMFEDFPEVDIGDFVIIKIK